MKVVLLTADTPVLSATRYAVKHNPFSASEDAPGFSLTLATFRPRKLARQAPAVKWLAFVYPDEEIPVLGSLLVYDAETGTDGKPLVRELHHLRTPSDEMVPVIRVTDRLHDEETYAAYRRITTSLGLR